ncbi:hypothetical protein [Natronosalvus vescus]|uniref:hypothetical protein n=1 Tax=Natronosalvus vescus TaxID=2953881 RepID=UPI0020905FAB|nr:hypothetical protein [Natronosalvus vescus]
MGQYGSRIAALERQAERDHQTLADGTCDADPERARSYLREGVGPAVWIYVEARTGGRRRYISPAEFDALERAMNRWFECYAACHGVDLEAEYTVREVAELLLETRNIHDVGELLTGVPVSDGE